MIYEQKKLKLAGLKKDYAEMQPELASALWKKFLLRLPEIKNIIGQHCYGVVRPKDGRTEYFCGVEISSEADLPEGMQVLEVPPSTYAKFKHTGPIITIGRTVHSIYSKWLPLCEWKHNKGPDLEIYEIDYDPSSDQAYMYYAIPIQT